MKPRICLIHAVRLAIDPVAEAFARLWPEAELMNLLDDSLSIDRQRNGMLTPKMTARFQTLAQYAGDVGVNGILFTCSAFGPAIEAVQKKLAPRCGAAITAFSGHATLRCAFMYSRNAALMRLW